MLQSPIAQPAAQSHSQEQGQDDTVPTHTQSEQETATDVLDPWPNFTLPSILPVSHPYLARYSPSVLLTNRAIASNSISTAMTAVYGNHTHPIAFSIGNGGAGYTNLLRIFCLNFIWSHGADFRIAWVANHSRHAQISLLGDVVQVALTYEPEWDLVGEREGWCRRVVAPVFWDHFVLVGPAKDAAGLGTDGDLEIRAALGRVMKGGQGVKFFSRGDGSATFTKERAFLDEVGVDLEASDCMETHPLPPYKALVKAQEGGAYMLTDRATFLSAKRDGVIPDLQVFVEGGKDLLNPCSALINTKVPHSPYQRLAVRFAEWLAEEHAQSLCSGYGRVWELGQPLFTRRDREEFGEEETLIGKVL